MTRRERIYFLLGMAFATTVSLVSLELAIYLARSLGAP